MAEQSPIRQVEAHYGRRDLGEMILAGLRAAGKDPDALLPDDLSPVDHFHVRGKPATLELAGLARIAPGARVLDVGGGIGGPARTLAGAFGCRVTVLDLTERYCRVGEMLTGRTGLGGRVTFRHGSALEMPFPDGSFDVAWTEHSSMNIADKERLYAEIHRVVRRGGRLALYEVMAGPVAPIHFPVPWATDPGISFLRPPEEIRTLLGAAGFREGRPQGDGSARFEPYKGSHGSAPTPGAWVDVTEPALSWLRERVADAQSGPPPLSPRLILGDDFPVMFGNLVRNTEEDRVRFIQGVFDRP
jgi:SAM-dependent methyltransferase